MSRCTCANHRRFQAARLLGFSKTQHAFGEDVWRASFTIPLHLARVKGKTYGQQLSALAVPSCKHSFASMLPMMLVIPGQLWHFNRILFQSWSKSPRSITSSRNPFKSYLPVFEMWFTEKQPICCWKMQLIAISLFLLLQLWHVREVSVFLACQELLQMDLELANVTNLSEDDWATQPNDKRNSSNGTKTTLITEICSYCLWAHHCSILRLVMSNQQKEPQLLQLDTKNRDMQTSTARDLLGLLL